MQANTILAGAIVAILAAAAIWDVVANASDNKIGTVSSVLSQWGRDLPIFTLAIGVIIGHLFWPPDKRR